MEDTITLTRKELIDLLDQYSNCKLMGIKEHWNDTNRNSIEGWVSDTIF